MRHPPPPPLFFFPLSRTEESAKTGSCVRDRRALQQLALNVQHSDLTWPDLTWRALVLLQFGCRRASLPIYPVGRNGLQMPWTCILTLKQKKRRRIWYCTSQCRRSPLSPSPPFFPCPEQRNRRRPVPVPVTGVRYDSLLWMCTLNTLTWPDLYWPALKTQWLKLAIYTYLIRDPCPFPHLEEIAFYIGKTLWSIHWITLFRCTHSLGITL